MFRVQYFKVRRNTTSNTAATILDSQHKKMNNSITVQIIPTPLSVDCADAIDHAALYHYYFLSVIKKFQKYLNIYSPKTGYILHSKFKWETKLLDRPREIAQTMININ